MMLSCETVSARWVSNCERRVTLFCNIAEICLLHVIATARVSEALFSDVPAAIHWKIQSKKILKTSTIDLRVSSE